MIEITQKVYEKQQKLFWIEYIITHIINFICNLHLFLHSHRKNTVRAYQSIKPSSTKATRWCTTTSQNVLSKTYWTKRSTKISRIMSSSISVAFPITYLLDTVCSNISSRSGTWQLLRTFHSSSDRAQKKSSVQQHTSRVTPQSTRCKSTTRAATPRTCSRVCYQRRISRRAAIMSIRRSVIWTITKSVLENEK